MINYTIFILFDKNLMRQKLNVGKRVQFFWSNKNKYYFIKILPRKSTRTNPRKKKEHSHSLDIDHRKSLNQLIYISCINFLNVDIGYNFVNKSVTLLLERIY